MAALSSFSLNWWYSPTTKLSIAFQVQGANVSNKLDSSNGLSASVEESYRSKNIITNQPVESGTNISDHIIIQPKSINIVGFLTALKSIPLVGGVSASFLNFYQLGNAIKFLQDASDSRQLFTLVTGLYFGQSYYSIKNMAIESLDIPRTNQYGKTSIRFNITFKEVIITSTNPQSTNTSTQAALDPNIIGVI